MDRESNQGHARKTQRLSSTLQAQLSQTSSSKQRGKQPRWSRLPPPINLQWQRNGTKARPYRWRTFPRCDEERSVNVGGLRCQDDGLGLIVDILDIKKVDNQSKTIVLELLDRTVENVSRSRVVWAWKTKTKPDRLAKDLPMKLTEIFSNYNISKEDNLRHI